MNIKNSIVAILNSRGKIVGTGFLASQNLVVTCAHVIVAAGAIDGDTVQVRFDGQTEKLNALAVPEYWRDIDKGDVAVLRLENVPAGVSPLHLGNAAGSPGYDFYAYGYATVTDVQGIGARGKIVDIVDNGRLVQLISQEPDHGMSGGPVLDEQRRVVIGMVTKGKGLLESQNFRNTQTTFATSVEVMREACPELRLTEICPYRSLDVFNEEDAPFFFGREKVVQKLLDSLKREPRFLAVMGPSGSGKSSVVRAGLIPALRQGKVPDSQKWGIVIIRPANDPFEQLTGEGFINPQDGLEVSVKTWLEDRPDKVRLILVFDQFENVLVSNSEELHQKFIKELKNLLDTPIAITVVLTLRDDFYSRFLQDAAVLTLWFERGLVNVPTTLDEDELHSIIFDPAQSVGLTFDEGLVDGIISDTVAADSAKEKARSTILPLLEFALAQLWEKRQNGQLTNKAYKAIGKVTGGLTQWADRAYYALNVNEQKLAKNIFGKLIHLGDEKTRTPDTRRVIQISEFGILRSKGNVEKVVSKLVQARLLSTQRDISTGLETIEIIHESLLREWGLLRRWIDDFRNLERRSRERRLRRLSVTFAVLAILGIGLAIIAFWQQRVSEAMRLASDAKVALSNKEYNLAGLLALESFDLANTDQGAAVLAEFPYSGPSLGKAFLQPDGFVVSSVAWSPDGKIASGGGCGTDGAQVSCQGDEIAIWNPQTGQLLERLHGHTSHLNTLSWSRDGKLASADANGIVIVWNLELAKPDHIYQSDQPILSLAWSPNDRLAVGSCAGFDANDNCTQGKILIWDPSTNLPPQVLLGHTDFVESLAWSTDGQLASGSYDGNTILWNLVTGQPDKIFVWQGYISGIAWSPENRLASASTNGSIAIWDLENGTPAQVLQSDNDIYAIAWSPSGQLASSSSVGIVIIWDLGAGLPFRTYFGTGKIESLAWSDDNRLVSGSKDGTIVVWDIQKTDLRPQELKGHSSSVSSLAWSNDGILASASREDGKVFIWNLKLGKPIKILEHGKDTISSVAWSGDDLLAAGSDYYGSVYVWDMTEEKIIHVLHSQSGWINSVAWSLEGLLASGYSGGSIIIWDLKDEKPAQVLQGHHNWVNSVDWSSDGHLASGSEDGNVIIWNLGTGQPARILVGNAGGINSVAWSPTGQLAAGSDDGSVIVWDLQAGGSTRILRGHTGYVRSVAWSPEGRLASVSEDGTIIWNLETNQPSQKLSAHNNGVFSLTWSPKDVLTTGAPVPNNTIQLLPPNYNKPICELLLRNLTEEEWMIYVGEFYVYIPTCPNLPTPKIANPLLTMRGRFSIAGIASAFLILFLGICWLLINSTMWWFGHRESNQLARFLNK